MQVKGISTVENAKFPVRGLGGAHWRTPREAGRFRLAYCGTQGTSGRVEEGAL